MTSAQFIHAQRQEDLDRFEEALGKLDGVTEEHLYAMRRASSSVPGNPRFPKHTDLVGLAAYQASALRGLAESLLVLQEEASASAKSPRPKTAKK